MRDGLVDGASLLAGILPLGFALGAGLAATSVPPLLAWATAPVLMAGASQLVLVGQLDGGASAIAAAAAAVVVNGRFVVYGAALARRFADQPTWFRWLGPHWVVDQTYALTSNRFGDVPVTAGRFRRYFTSAATVLSLAWTLSVGAGVLFGAEVPAAVPLDFVVPAMFIALVVPGLGSTSEAAVAVTAAALAFLLPGATAPLVAAGVVGIAIGGSTQERDR